MKTIRVGAPGKLHIIGEHVAVYGKPAILSSVNKWCTAEITENKDDEVIIISEDLDTKMQITEDIILDRTKTARNAWYTFQETHNISLLSALIVDPLNLAVIAIGETMVYYKKHLQKGFTLKLTCTIPIGSGMGSSAAMAVSVIGAVSQFLEEPFDTNVINAIAFLVEQKIHGNPSGGDNSVCSYGGLLWFRRETQELRIIQPLRYSLSQELQKQFYVFYTGKPVETTGEMVSSVRVLYGKKPTHVEKILNDQEILCRSLEEALRISDTAEVINIFKASERNLEELEVVSVSTTGIIRKIESAGGAAKISGAGGRKQHSGIVLAIHEDPGALLEIAKKNNIVCEPVHLGVEGVKIL